MEALGMIETRAWLIHRGGRRSGKSQCTTIGKEYIGAAM